MKYSGRLAGLFFALFQSLSWLVYASFTGKLMTPFAWFMITGFALLGSWLGHAYDRAKIFAEKDFLTGLYNRRFIAAIFPKLQSQAERSGKSLALLLVDLDQFKKINDACGHKAGDEVLVRLAEILVRNTRQTDFVARWGGDEFLIIAPSTDREGAEEIEARIKHKLRQFSGEKKIQVDASIGIAIYPDDARTFDELVKAADEKMYKEKKETSLHGADNPLVSS
ncbi:hypothetical protein BSNK01_25310 [Bacillaceae bacterium]